MAAKFQAMKSHISESLAKVQAKSWAKPLGQTLAISGKIVKGMGDFIPGASIVGGALAFGSSLLNPEPSMQDLQRELRDIQITLEEGSQSNVVIRALQTEQRTLQEKMSNSQGEINSNFKEVQIELQLMIKKVGESNMFMTEEISKLKDVISKTYDLVTDSRYKDGIEKVDAAYEVFIRDGFDGFEHFSFELKTIATMNLAPKRIKEYLEIIHERGGITMCQSVLEYVIVILGKYLQMMVAYSIFKEDQDKVTLQFQQFNQHFTELGEVFIKVTTQAFKPGQRVDLITKRPTAEVKPSPRGELLKVSQVASDEVNAFLRKNGLTELKEVFSGSGVTLEDVLQMDDQEMRDLGIQAYRTRRALLKAIRDHQPNQPSPSEFTSRALPTTVREYQPNQPSQSEVTSRAFRTNVLEYQPNQPSQSEVTSPAFRTNVTDQLDHQSSQQSRSEAFPTSSVFVSCDMGVASEYLGCYMGLFHKNKSDNTFTQAGGGQFIYQVTDGTWIIGPTMMGTGGYMMNTTVPYSTIGSPPTHGWQFYDGSKYIPDNLLTVTSSANFPSCRAISLQSTKCSNKDALGIYRKIDGDLLNGRPVFRNEKGCYLRVATGGTGWEVSNVRDDRICYIESGRATSCPSHSMAGTNAQFTMNNWKCAVGGELVEDVTLTVHCEKHS